MNNLILSADELQQLTGYRVPSKQLQELHRQGFWRARRSKITNHVILERSHYDAVTRGADTKPGPRPHPTRVRAA